MIKFEDVTSSQPEYAAGISSFVISQRNPAVTTTSVFQHTDPATEVLTPTTLNTLEQTSYSAHSSHPGSSYQQAAPLMSTADWQYEPSAKRMCLPSQYSSAVQSSSYAMEAQNLTVSHEDQQKRKVRRERNKVAAAKCRQRRVDLTNQLQGETDDLEVEKAKYMEEIRDLQREKEQLEFVLQAHRPMCKMENIPLADRPMDLKVYPRSRAESSCSNESTERPTCLSISTKRQEFDLNTPVFNDKTPVGMKKPGCQFKAEPVELNTPTWSDASAAQTPTKHFGRMAGSSGSSSNCDYPQALAGSSCGIELRNRSSSSSTTSETKSPVRTLMSL